MKLSLGAPTIELCLSFLSVKVSWGSNLSIPCWTFLPPVKAKEKQNTIPTNCAFVHRFWSTRVHISYPTLAYMRWTPRPNAASEGAAVEFRSQVHLHHISGGIFPDAYFVLVTLLYPILVPESSAGHVKTGSRGFLTERSSFTRCSLLFPPLLAGFNVVDVDFHFNLAEKNCSDCQSEADVNLK